MLENCILDVASTGHFGFATAGATVERSARKKRGGATPPPAAADVRWTRISAGAATNSLLLVPSLALANGEVVAAYVSTDRSAEAATFVPSVQRDVVGLSRHPIATGPERLGNPQLLPRAGGGLQALVDGVPLQSISFAARNAEGSFGSPALAAGDIHATATGPAVLAPDGQPLWPANYGGSLSLWKGSAGAVSSDLTSVAAPPASSIYIPKLARDAQGRYWLAWYVISTRTPKQSGIYVARVDPGSLKFVGAPQRAPGSETNVNNGLELALACAQACRVAYVQQVSAARARIVSWAPGGAPATIAAAGRSGEPTYRVSAVYAPSGRLWVSWWDVTKKHFVATLGNAAGTGGRVLAIGRPAGSSGGAGALSAIATGADLVLVANWPAPDGRSAARYVNVVRAPG